MRRTGKQPDACHESVPMTSFSSLPTSIPTASAARIWTVSPPWKKRKRLLSGQKMCTRIWKRWRRMASPERERASRHSPAHQSGRWHGDRPWRFCRFHLQAGHRLINVPTTLLAMVDASVGGKTGINFNGLKNEIGVLLLPPACCWKPNSCAASMPITSSPAMREMLKHGLISTPEHLAELLSFDTER